VLLMPSKSHLFIEPVWFLTNLDYQTIVQERLSSEIRRDVIIDNSVHLLGSPLPLEVLVNIALQLPEDHNYILVAPDYLNDFKRTIEKVTYINHLRSEGFSVMSICQGVNFDEYRICHEVYIQFECEAIGFPFKQKGSSADNALNRKAMIDGLIEEGIIRSEIYYHLFGLNRLQELELYQSTDYDFINSCDSSKIKEVKFT
jgi:hypothetical protein